MLPAANSPVVMLRGVAISVADGDTATVQICAGRSRIDVAEAGDAVGAIDGARR